jgi:hypothetical protein
MSVLHHVLIRCDSCNFTREQLAVIDEAGEDCLLFNKLDEVRQQLRENPRQCGCGQKYYATYSASVIEQHLNQ